MVFSSLRPSCRLTASKTERAPLGSEVVASLGLAGVGRILSAELKLRVKSKEPFRLVPSVTGL